VVADEDGVAVVLLCAAVLFGSADAAEDCPLIAALLSLGVVEVSGVLLGEVEEGDVVEGEVVEFVVEELPVVVLELTPLASVEFGVDPEVEFGAVVELAFGDAVLAPAALPLWSVLLGVVLVLGVALEFGVALVSGVVLVLPTPVVLPLVPVDCPDAAFPGALMSPVEFGFEVDEDPVVLCGVAVVVVVVVVVPGGVVVVVVALDPACPEVLSGVAVLLDGVALVLLCDASVPVLLLGAAVEVCPDMLPVEL
jgi:hypothetical protein